MRLAATDANGLAATIAPDPRKPPTTPMDDRAVLAAAADILHDAMLERDAQRRRVHNPWDVVPLDFDSLYPALALYLAQNGGARQ